MRKSADAMVAPVLPADTMADALPSRTASAARTSDESFILRTLEPGSASIAITSDAGITSRPWSVPSSSGRPTSTTSPTSAAARTAPSTFSSGALSPPIASTAMGRRLTGCLLDFDSLAAVVPAAVRAHDVRELGGAAPRAHAAGGRAERPGAGPPAPALRLRRLLLRDCHAVALAHSLGVARSSAARRWRFPRRAAEPEDSRQTIAAATDVRLLSRT